jgi:HEAT repeat protein
MQDPIRALSDPDPKIRRRAIDALCEQKSVEALPGLILALRDPVEAVRSDAALAIWFLGPAAADAVDALCAALRDRSSVRTNAAGALKQIGRASAPALPALVSALSDRNEDVRWNSILAIKEIGPIPDLVPALLPLLRDKSKNVRADVQRCFAMIGPPAAAAIPDLRTNLKHRDVTVRVTASRALWAVSGDVDAALALFQKEFGSAGPAEQQEIVETLAQMEKDDRVAELLLQALHDEDGLIRVAAAEGLTRKQERPTKGVPELIALLRHEDWFVRRGAASALERLRKLAAPSLPALRRACQDEDERVCVVATAALEIINAAT